MTCDNCKCMNESDESVFCISDMVIALKKMCTCGGGELDAKCPACKIMEQLVLYNED
jgi:hypothetical protein